MNASVAVMAPPRPRYKRNPLRCIVAREIIRHRFDWQPHSLILHELLECGHPYDCIAVSPEDISARRRRCAACGARAARSRVARATKRGSGVTTVRPRSSAPIPIRNTRGGE